MEYRVMVELTEETNKLKEISGFELDNEYEPISLKKKGTDNETLLFQGIITDKRAVSEIKQLPEFVVIWNNQLIDSVYYLVDDTGGDFEYYEGEIKEDSEKGEFELFLLCLESRGENTDFYRKWIQKMEESGQLPKPVFQKLKKEFGTYYSITKTEEATALYNTIQDKSHIKNY